MEKKEFKVGEVFQCGLIKLKYVEQRTGLGCYDCFSINLVAVLS